MARRKRRNHRGRRSLPSVLTLLLALAVLLGAIGWKYWTEYSLPQPIQGDLELHVIDVGQGESILLRSGTESMLIDTGLREAGDDVSEYLQNLGIQTLDRLLITHDHSDHRGGIKRVLKDIDTKVLMLYDGGDRDSGYQLAGDLAGSSSCDIAFVEAGQQFPLGDAVVKVIFPIAGYHTDDLNDESVVLLVECGGKRILLTSDSTAAAELLYYEDLPTVDVLKVAHHGSGGSSSVDLLKKIRPKLALISCGLDNDYGHPHDRVTQALAALGAEVYRTDKQGDLVVTLKDGALTVKTQR